MSGAFMMLRREALDKVGLLDEDFFMYGEDIDLSYRLLKGGYENWYVPTSIVHYKGESTQKSSYRYVHVFYQAMLIFFRKHYGHLSFFVTIPIKLAIYFRAFIALVQMHYQRLRSGLGFDAKDHDGMTYYFMGSATMIEQCRHLSCKRGLVAHFLETASLPSPMSTPGKHPCMVYDADLFSYGQIIAHAAAHAANHALIGTFSNRTKTIITQREIIQ